MLSRKLALDHIPQLINNKRVLMRVDFNVPIKEGKIKDMTRIEGALPSINYCLDHNARSLVLMSHLGRPDGQRNEKYSLKPLVQPLEDLLKKKVRFLNDCVGSEVEKVCQNPGKGEIILLENLRFHMAEEGKGVINGEKVKAPKDEITAFRNSLTSLGDIFVNDAFGTAHRAHSSMVGINVPTRAAGFLMKKELEYFSKVLESPQHPFLVILGGAKVKDKIQLIMKMLDVADEMIIGGGMAFTFHKTLQNAQIGKSLYDEEGAKVCQEIMDKAKQRGVKIHLPEDYITADQISDNPQIKVKTISNGIDEGWMGLDIGPNTIQKDNEVIKRAKTIFWNGPQGLFENAKFRQGSLALLNEVIGVSQKSCTTVVGGGDTVSLLGLVKGAADKIQHVSTGGGASLELMEGKELPGIKALSDRT